MINLLGTKLTLENKTEVEFVWYLEAIALRVLKTKGKPNPTHLNTYPYVTHRETKLWQEVLMILGKGS